MLYKLVRVSQLKGQYEMLSYNATLFPCQSELHYCQKNTLNVILKITKPTISPYTVIVNFKSI